jgi:hypothetical protein
VLPKILVPPVGRWMTRRRGGRPPEPVGAWGAAASAAMVAEFVVVVSSDR